MTISQSVSQARSAAAEWVVIRVDFHGAERGVNQQRFNGTRLVADLPTPLNSLNRQEIPDTSDKRLLPHHNR